MNNGTSQNDTIGIVYIVTKEKAPLRIRDDYWLDFEAVINFFDNLVDKYEVTIEHSVTHSKFMNFCQYLGDSHYPSSCKRIIIYFSGDGDDGYIRIQKDIKKPKKTEKVEIIDILSCFRNSKCKHLERILLLDACCNVECIKCEENELVACATSERYLGKRFVWPGLTWTKELWTMLNEKQTCDLVTVLKDVQEGMLGKGINQFPSFKDKVKREIKYEKCMSSMYLYTY